MQPKSHESNLVLDRHVEINAVLMGMGHIETIPESVDIESIVVRGIDSNTTPETLFLSDSIVKTELINAQRTTLTDPKSGVGHIRNLEPKYEILPQHEPIIIDALEHTLSLRGLSGLLAKTTGRKRAAKNLLKEMQD